MKRLLLLVCIASAACFMYVQRAHVPKIYSYSNQQQTKSQADLQFNSSKYRLIYGTHTTPQQWVNQDFYLTNNIIIRPTIEKIITDTIHVEAGDSTRQKTIKIGTYILSKLDSNRGDPIEWKYSNAYELWNGVVNTKVPVACMELSLLYALFANFAGIHTRIVSIKTSYLGTNISHTVAESYSLEDQKWYVVDLTYHQLFITKTNTELLNTYELLSLFANSDSFSPLPAILYYKSGPVNLFGGLPETQIGMITDQRKYFNSSTKLSYQNNMGLYDELRLEEN